jgi:hypothetical protein
VLLSLEAGIVLRPHPTVGIGLGPPLEQSAVISGDGGLEQPLGISFGEFVAIAAGLIRVVGVHIDMERYPFVSHGREFHVEVDELLIDIGLDGLELVVFRGRIAGRRSNLGSVKLSPIGEVTVDGNRSDILFLRIFGIVGTGTRFRFRIFVASGQHHGSNGQERKLLFS